jgi:hypothetical protein
VPTGDGIDDKIDYSFNFSEVGSAKISQFFKPVFIT